MLRRSELAARRSWSAKYAGPLGEGTRHLVSERHELNADSLDVQAFVFELVHPCSSVRYVRWLGFEDTP